MQRSPPASSPAADPPQASRPVRDQPSREPECYASDMQRSAGEIEARRRGRFRVMIAYYAIVAGFILLAAGNVTYQVWAPVFRSYPEVDCRKGLATLAQAIDRARQAASAFS